MSWHFILIWHHLKIITKEMLHELWSYHLRYLHWIESHIQKNEEMLSSWDHTVLLHYIRNDDNISSYDKRNVILMKSHHFHFANLTISTYMRSHYTWSGITSSFTIYVQKGISLTYYHIISSYTTIYETPFIILQLHDNLYLYELIPWELQALWWCP